MPPPPPTHTGTLTHMAPEVLLQGKVSRASDVYAFGILLWELYTGGRAFAHVPLPLLGHEVARGGLRPVFPGSCPVGFQEFAARCWAANPADRCAQGGRGRGGEAGRRGGGAGRL